MTMRYFVAKNGTSVVSKQVFSGDMTKVDGIVSTYQTNNPQLTVTEVDQPTFDSIVVTPLQTQAQAAWATLKSSTPTPLQLLTFIAHFIGLE